MGQEQPSVSASMAGVAAGRLPCGTDAEEARLELGRLTAVLTSAVRRTAILLMSVTTSLLHSGVTATRELGG